MRYKIKLLKGDSYTVDGSDHTISLINPRCFMWCKIAAFIQKESRSMSKSKVKQ